MQKHKLSFEIFLVSLAVILLEVGYTRVFSYKLVYYFTYVIIGISLLGLGAGAVCIAMFPRLRQASVERLIPGCGLLGASSVLVGYWAVAAIQLNAHDLAGAIGAPLSATLITEGGKLAAICIALFVPFLLAGVVVSTILSTRAEDVHRLYFADLMGAALGCALCVPLMATLSPPGCVLLGGFFFAIASLRLASSSRRILFPILSVLALASLVLSFRPNWLGDPVTDRLKTMSGEHEVLFSRWSPVFRVDVVEGLPGAGGHMIVHDGMWGSLLAQYDGNPASLARFERDSRSLPFALLEPRPSVAIIGAAGGNEILASTHFGASHVTAVELNPVTVSLLTEHFPDFTGRIAEHDAVELVTAEGRSFLRSDPRSYDLIWFVAPDSYAAMNAATSGAYVLSESYLYTAEMIGDSLDHLQAGGVICAQFGEHDLANPSRTARYLATAREAFAQHGIEDFSKHVLVGSTPGFAWRNVSIMLRAEPFSSEEINRYALQMRRLREGAIHFRWDREPAPHPVQKVIQLPRDELAAWMESYRYDVRPVTDDSPFFWHFVSFGAALGADPSRGESLEDGIGERLLVALLVAVTALGAVFLLSPLLVRRSLWRAIPYKGPAAVYFGALGLGFMFLEVSLIQRLTLFLGYPTYSLTVTLFSILVATGLGSLLSERLIAPRRTVLLGAFGTLGALVLFYLFGLSSVIGVGIGWSLPLRIALTVLLLTPLGLCLGIFMPLGLRTVASLTPHAEEYVAWAWAINGFFSVISSVLTTMLSMTFGFDAVMGIALGVYAVGGLALLRIPEA